LFFAVRNNIDFPNGYSNLLKKQSKIADEMKRNYYAFEYHAIKTRNFIL